ncbi:MAG: hypothetical protein ACXVZ3_09145, partial [Gaiellaceae bacterium]
ASVDEDKVGFLKQLVAVMAVPNLATHTQKALIFDIARAVILLAYSATKPKARPPLLHPRAERRSFRGRRPRAVSDEWCPRVTCGATPIQAPAPANRMNRRLVRPRAPYASSHVLDATAPGSIWLG